jgi:hypothetical protein
MLSIEILLGECILNKFDAYYDRFETCEICETNIYLTSSNLQYVFFFSV